MPYQQINPFVASLIDASLVTDRSPSAFELTDPSSIDIESYLDSLGENQPRELANRIHFMGALADTDFQAGMAICDAVVFPYIEVGQSSSGPISLALELGCRIIASRTLAFLDFAAYHPNRIEFFDIGNHLELAQRIAARPRHAAPRSVARYNSETNKAVYLAANSVHQIGPPRFARRTTPAGKRYAALGGG